MSDIAIMITTAALVASGELDGKPVYVNVPRTHPLYSKMVDAYKAGDREEVLRLADIATRVNDFGKGHFVVVDGVVYITDCDKPAPPVLSRKIVDFAKQDLPVEPLVNFWKNLCANPSYRSREQLFGFLEANHVPLTEDGCFVAYKAVTRAPNGDLWDTYTYNRGDKEGTNTGTYRNNVGDSPEMDRSTVDDDPNRTCSEGLHVAAHDYALNHYGAWNSGVGEGMVLVHIKVNPADVVSVPTDYNDQKMRVCRYTVLAVSEDRKEMDDDLYEDDIDVDGDTTDVSQDMQSDERLRYVKPRTDGALEIPQAFAKLFGNIGCSVKAVPEYETIKIYTHNNGPRTMRPGFRVSMGMMASAGILYCSEYAVEISEDCETITITPA